MKKILFMFFFFLFSGLLHASNLQALVDSANQRYRSGDFDLAIKNYEQVLAEGMEAPELYYNLGNSYFKLGKTALAILNYEKAKKLSPNDEDIQYNLKLANQLILDKIEAPPTLFLTEWKNDLFSTLSEKGWSLFCIILFAAFTASLGTYLISRAVWIKQLTFWLMIVLFTGSLSCFFIARAHYEALKAEQEAIIIVPSVTVKGSPNENGTKLFILHEGTKVSIEAKNNNWTEVKLPNGNVGWVSGSSLAVI